MPFLTYTVVDLSGFASSTYIVMAPLLADLSPIIIFVVGVVLAVTAIVILIKVLTKH